jgi:hypothetical protein
MLKKVQYAYKRQHKCLLGCDTESLLISDVSKRKIISFAFKIPEFKSTEPGWFQSAIIYFTVVREDEIFAMIYVFEQLLTL